MSIALVHQAATVATSGANPTPWSFGFAAATANRLVLIADASNSHTPVVASITQTNVTWTKVVSENAGSDFEMWEGIPSGTPGTSLTIAWSAALSGATTVEISEWSGNWPVGTAVDTSAPNAATSTAPTTSTITPTAGKSVVIIAGFRANGAVSAGPTNSFTALTDTGTLQHQAYLIDPNAAGIYSTGWTIGSSAWDCAFLVLAEASLAGDEGYLVTPSFIRTPDVDMDVQL